MVREEQQRRSQREPAVPTLPPLSSGCGAAAHERAAELDDRFGEIDSVLEVTAASFVRGFVQDGT